MFVHGDPPDADRASELLQRVRALAPDDSADLTENELDREPIDEPAVAIILPSNGSQLNVARRCRRRWLGAHLLLVRPPLEDGDFRTGMGPAPMLGQNWSLAVLDESLLVVTQQAMASVRQRKAFRATVAGANAQLAGTHVPRHEYQRLMVAERYLETFLRRTTDAVFALDDKLEVLFWSGGAVALFGLEALQVLGRPLRELGAWAETVVVAARSVLSNGEPVTCDAEVARTGHEGRPVVEFALAPVVPATGHAHGVSVLGRDVTDARRKQAQLVEANETLEALVEARTQELERNQLALIQAQKLEAVGRLTGGVAHDFNNVLQVIGSNLQLMMMRAPTARGDEAMDSLVRAALSAVDRGARLSSQLLAFARRQPLNPRVLNVNRRVQEMDELLRRAIGEHIELECISTGGLWTTLADPVQLENLILNLAINARDAMPDAGRLTIETSNATLDDAYVTAASDVPSGQYVMLAVSDTGTGMPPDVAAQAFEPFFTTKPEGKGTGLGLSMAYGFAKQSGGHIRIYSELGVGTTIKLYLPRSHEKELLPVPLPNAALSRGSETILVVEDDPAVQLAVSSMLQVLGYRVLRANEAQAALSILQSGVHVDLLFTDVVMPGPLRSPEMARRAKQLIPGLVVLFTSGYTHNAIVHGGRLDPGVELLSKPYRQEDLATKLRQLLAREPDASPEPSLPGASTGQCQSVLLVEDDGDMRDTCAQMIGILGHRVTAVASAEEAFTALAAATFGLLLTDVKLPGKSGVQLAIEAARLYPDMKIVFASGYGNAVDAPASLNYSVMGKPYGFEELQALLSGIGR
ncbi:MAG: response regulator [Ramlibacter sp.]|nr:response regulator [Ramlibacter sp.]